MGCTFLPIIWEAKEHYFLEPRLTKCFGCFSFLGNRVKKHILPVMKNNMEYGGKTKVLGCGIVFVLHL